MIFGENLTKEIQLVLQGANVFAITDDHVFGLYGELFDKKRTFVLTHGEDRKHLGSISEICAFLLQSGANRHSTIVAVGGGVVGDITGFCAAIYMRGIAWVNVPTTLLAQCDSAIGGKTGVDLGQVKNILGSFWLPEEIYCSAHFLQTLPEREYKSGLGELLKTACLSGEIFDFYKSNRGQLANKDARALQTAVSLCARFKDSVVTRDPYEKTGLRKILNYGHTVGHAFEAADCHRLSHGEYVLYGMLVENRMCRDIIDSGFLTESEELIGSVLSDRRLHIDIGEVVAAACLDKKNQSGNISVVAVLKPGETKEVFFSKQEFENAFASAYTHD